MSAECDTCGTDLVGTQYDEDGLTCPACAPRAELERTRLALRWLWAYTLELENRFSTWAASRPSMARYPGGDEVRQLGLMIEVILAEKEESDE